MFEDKWKYNTIVSSELKKSVYFNPASQHVIYEIKKKSGCRKSIFEVS